MDRETVHDANVQTKLRKKRVLAGKKTGESEAEGGGEGWQQKHNLLRLHTQQLSA